MAVYKVIQDIEAEDKLLGPLTLKGFIYFAIAGLLAFINVRLLIAGGPIYIRLAIIFILLFPMLLFGVLASPLGRDQPTEVWLLSHIRFMLKQHIRNWDKAGIDHLVTITAPKRLDMHLTKDFTQTEVQSRLQALATTLDSRGWVVKNSNVNLSSQPNYLEEGASDRLISPSSVAQLDQVLDVHASDDILDEQNNATAQKFNELMQVADSQRKEAIIEKINAVRAGRTDPTSSLNSTVSTTDETLSAEAQALLEHEHKIAADIHRRSASFKSKASQEEMKRSEALATRQSKEEKTRQDTVTAAQTAAKLELAQSGNALSVASVAQLANRVGMARQIGPGEVEISLH